MAIFTNKTFDTGMKSLNYQSGRRKKFLFITYPFVDLREANKSKKCFDIKHDFTKTTNEDKSSSIHFLILTKIKCVPINYPLQIDREQLLIWINNKNITNIPSGSHVFIRMDRKYEGMCSTSSITFPSIESLGNTSFTSNEKSSISKVIGVDFL